MISIVLSIIWMVLVRIVVRLSILVPQKVQFGAKRKLSDDDVAELKRLRADGERIKHLMKDYRISKATVYRYLREE